MIRRGDTETRRRGEERVRGGDAETRRRGEDSLSPRPRVSASPCRVSTPSPRRISSARRAFALPELIVTIGIIGILASISIAQFRNLTPAARQEIGVDAMNLLNRGVLHYNQVNSKITEAAAAGTADELAVLDMLKARDAADPAPGSPYIPSQFSATTSSSTDTVRITWTGEFFKLIPEGTAGTGIVVAQ